MGKFKDRLIEDKVIDFSKNDLNVNKIIKSSDGSLELILDLSNILPFSEFMNLKSYTINLFKSITNNFKLTINYLSKSLESEEALKYLKNAFKESAKVRVSLIAFSDLEVKYNDLEYTFLSDTEGLCMINNLAPIKKYFEDNYYFTPKFKMEVDENVKSLSQMRKETVEAKIEEIKNLNIEIEEKKEKAAVIREKRISYKDEPISKISDIPFNQESLLTYNQNVGLPLFKIQGEIFKISVDRKKNSYLVKAYLYDGTDSILVNKWVRSDEDADKISKWGIGDIISASGRAEYSQYEREVVLNAQTISFVDSKKEHLLIDDAPRKRIEFAVHTKMSTMDGIATTADYLNFAFKNEIPAMGFTDIAGVYEYSDIVHAKKPDFFKPIYGVELPFIDDTNYQITFTDHDLILRDQTYVVFDLETTGLSQEYDRITEIAATKVKNGQIIDTFNTFVNPEMKIPQKITELTSITDDMVKDAKTIKEILPEFLKFIDGTIIVGHNVKFDAGQIYANARRLGIECEKFPVIDSLNLFRAAYNKDVIENGIEKSFGLKALSKFFKVKQEQHHRAIDDTRVTAECFVQMLNDLYKKKIDNYNQINSLIDPNNFYKYVIPSTITLYAQNEKGLRNIYKLLSDSLTIHCFKEARLLKSVLNKFREGVLVCEGNYRSNMFEAAFYTNEDELRDIIKQLDFVAIQPPSSYYHIVSENEVYEEGIKETLKRIIRVSKELNKKVIATSDAFYINKEDRQYRDILIASPRVGGGRHYLHDRNSPYAHLRTTNEMLEEFSFLDDKTKEEIVIDNTISIADSIESFGLFTNDMYAPRDDEFKDNLGVPSIKEEMKHIVTSNLSKMYGDNPHPIVRKRVDRELNSIISNGYSSTYYMAYLLVQESVKHGYIVGSRGSVGSSLVATMMEITEINPLVPHYVCPNCHFQVFKMTKEEKEEYGVKDIEKPYLESLDNVESGYDLPDAVCPCCGATLKREGHDIPFETFLGFNGDKVPDIDLNFSSEYQAQAHQYIKDVFGVSHAFRGGTISTMAEKKAYGYVKAYAEEKNLNLRNCEIDRLSTKLIDVKVSTGQHPGGIVIVPNYQNIFEITPIQFPSDNIDNEWMTTHFDYHTFEANLLKLDCLGHDDPTLIRFFMNYVNEHQDKYPFTRAQDIPIDDNNIYKMFSSTSIFNLKEEDINSKVASFAVPEFGTNFVRGMLNDTMPKTFAQLVKISGLSHGTNVWLNNAKDLVLGNTEFGKIPFADIIGCRDDVMRDLINMGCESSQAFKIMEFIRKGKAKKDPAKWAEYCKYLKEHNVPEWYIWTCDRIEYLFPKAHATAYVLMALRIAWFKLYSPALFYAGWFTKRADAYDVETFLKGPNFIRQQIDRLSKMPSKTAKDDSLITSLEVALEMTCRGMKFLPIDIDKSDAVIFKIEGNDLRLPFVALDGLGEAAAMSVNIAKAERPFTSKDDVKKRTKINDTLFKKLDMLGAFNSLDEHEAAQEVGLFAFAD